MVYLINKSPYANERSGLPIQSSDVTDTNSHFFEKSRRSGFLVLHINYLYGYKFYANNFSFALMLNYPPLLLSVDSVSLLHTDMSSSIIALFQ